jgi:hypothetical protein
MHEYVQEDTVKGFWDLSQEDRDKAKRLDVDDLVDKGYIENPYEHHT